MRSFTRLAALIVLGTGLAGTAAAQQWPTRPVSLVVPFVPGGATDIIARLYSDKLAARLGQPVVVDNRPGGGGNLGPAFVAKSAPDGHVLFVGSSPGFVNARALSKDAGYDPAKDFVAVTLLATQAMLLTLHPSLSPNTLQEFIAFAKSQPGKLSYATPGIGTPHHLAMELLKLTAGLDIVHVPYRGGAPMTQDVVAGQVGTMFASYVIVGPHLRAGKLKVVAASGLRRIPQAPEVRTVTEQGLQGFDVESWFGLVAPTGTPEAAIARMTEAVQAVAAMDEVQQKLMQIGFEVAPVMSTAKFGELLKRDIARWSDVVSKAGIKPE
jgi:tripartite-type tricarboxylate transporter receptor subunit TctC